MLLLLLWLGARSVLSAPGYNVAAPHSLILVRRYFKCAYESLKHRSNRCQGYPHPKPAPCGASASMMDPPCSANGWWKQSRFSSNHSRWRIPEYQNTRIQNASPCQWVNVRSCEPFVLQQRGSVNILSAYLLSSTYKSTTSEILAYPCLNSSAFCARLRPPSLNNFNSLLRLQSAGAEARLDTSLTRRWRLQFNGILERRPWECASPVAISPSLDVRIHIHMR